MEFVNWSPPKNTFFISGIDSLLSKFLFLFVSCKWGNNLGLCELVTEFHCTVPSFLLGRKCHVVKYCGTIYARIGYGQKADQQNKVWAETLQRKYSQRYQFSILRIKEEDRITRIINMLVGIRQLIMCLEQDFFKYSHLTFNHTCLHNWVSVKYSSYL